MVKHWLVRDKSYLTQTNSEVRGVAKREVIGIDKTVNIEF